MLLSLLFLFAIFAVVICVISKNRKIIVILFLFLMVCASAVNEFMVLDDLNKLDGTALDADFVAINDAVHGEKVTRVEAYCKGNDKIPENTKFVVYYFFKTDIKCGESFNANVKLKSLEDNRYKAYNIGNSVYMNCQLKKINYFGKSNYFFTLLGKVRSFIKTAINNNYSVSDGAVLTAINTGDRSALSDEFYQNVL